MCSRTSTGQAHRTVQPKRSTDASSTSAAPPSGSATSPTTSPDPYSRPAASDPYYTVNCEERRKCGLGCLGDTPAICQVNLSRRHPSSTHPSVWYQDERVSEL